MDMFVVVVRVFVWCYDFYNEDMVYMQCGEFLRWFLEICFWWLKFKDYVIGQNKGKSFCYWVEFGIKNWVVIIGFIVKKFGIYFGKECYDFYDCFCYIWKFVQDFFFEGVE